MIYSTTWGCWVAGIKTQPLLIPPPGSDHSKDCCAIPQHPLFHQGTYHLDHPPTTARNPCRPTARQRPSLAVNLPTRFDFQQPLLACPLQPFFFSLSLSLPTTGYNTRNTHPIQTLASWLAGRRIGTTPMAPKRPAPVIPRLCIPKSSALVRHMLRSRSWLVGPRWLAKEGTKEEMRYGPLWFS